MARKCTEADYTPTQVDSVASLALSAWLFNPYTATISTRGNGDSLVVLQQLLVLILLQHSLDGPLNRGKSTGERSLVENSASGLLCISETRTRERALYFVLFCVQNRHHCARDHTAVRSHC